ncbi:MAG: hypothetical protein WCN98_15835, partial [Verrucomicrobiaceae bacterium]
VTLDGKILHVAILPCTEFLPAAGQGAIGIEARQNDSRTLAALSAINHADTFARVTAEREFLHLLKAGCQTPIGAHTWIDGGTLHMKVLVFDEAASGAPPFAAEDSGPLSNPRSVAASLANRVLNHQPVPNS